MFKHLLAALALTCVIAAPAAMADDSVEKATQAIRSLVPDTPIDSVSAAPVPGFQEVVINGQVLYVSNDGNFLMQGMLFDITNRVDLTEGRKATIRRTVMSDAPLAERIVFPAKDKKYTVAVFTDIDCGFCRKMHKQVAEYNDLGIEIQYLMFPRSGVGTESFRKAIAVWCDKNQQGALTLAKDGADPGDRNCTNPIEAQFNLGKKAGVTGTPSVIFEDGTLAPGYMPPDQLLQRLQQMEVAANATAAN